MPNLQGKVAVVTGASRGVGRAIALVLGEAGATVYVSGRSVQVGSTTEDLPGTINETAAAVTQQGGQGIAMRCDHTQESDIAALFAQVQQTHGRLDLLVNNVWGGYEQYDGSFDAPIWEQPARHWEGMFTAGVRAHLLASHHAAPLMLPQQQGLIINTTAWLEGHYLGNLFYDVAKAAINRMAYGLAHELRPHNIAAVALAPGFMRTERVLQAFQTDEQHWQSVPGMAHTETPFYTGRAVAALAADPDILHKSGQVLMVGHLAREYGFTDIDGRQVPPFTLAQAGLMPE
jgi:NAD(P)-dependent dehydrogenase (short-subunit alcohol dehydrogenase family)